MKWIKLLSDYAGHKTGDIIEVDEPIARAYIAAGKAEEHQAAEQSLIATAVSEVRGQLDAAMTALRQEVATELRTLAAGVRPTVQVVADEADKTRGFGDFVRQIELSDKRRDEEAFKRLKDVYKASRLDENGNQVRTLEGAQGANGGWLAPPEYATEMLRLTPEMAAVADRVRQVPMTGPVKEYPTLNQTGNANSGDSAAFAGIRTYRKSEKAQRTKSQPQFDKVKLEATDLIAYTEATRDILADAPGLQSDLLSLFREAIASKMDWEFLLADGVGKPLGMFHASNPALISVSRTTTNLIKYADVLSMLASFLPRAITGAYWLTNVTTIPQLGTLQDAAGNTVWVAANTGGARDALPATLMGLPVRFTEKVPALGSAGDLSLVNPAYYLHGLRAGVEIGVSEEFLFDTDEVAFRVKLRNDGRPWLKGTYKQNDGSNTPVSPTVRLAA